MGTQDLDILDIMGPGLMAIITPMVPMDILAMDFLDSMGPDLMAMVPILTPLNPTPTTLLARGLLMLNPLLIPTMGTMDMLLPMVMDMLPDLMDMLPMPRIPMDPDTMDTDGNYIPPSANNQPPCMLPDSEEDLKFSCGRCH